MWVLPLGRARDLILLLESMSIVLDTSRKHAPTPNMPCSQILPLSPFWSIIAQRSWGKRLISTTGFSRGDGGGLWRIQPIHQHSTCPLSGWTQHHLCHWCPSSGSQNVDPERWSWSLRWLLHPLPWVELRDLLCYRGCFLPAVTSPDILTSSRDMQQCTHTE